MPRLLLSDEHWSKLKPILLQNTIYHKRDLRMTVEGMLYRMRVGCPWRDLPRVFGAWSKVYKRFNDWCVTGKWLNIFQALVAEPDLDKGLYCYRHLVENVFVRLKQYRAVATRFDKLKRNYQGVVAMACAIMWLPM